jgi:uncharacterized protein
MKFKLLPNIFCYFHASKVPEFVYQSSFYSITKSDKELSIFCKQDLVEGFEEIDKDWRVLELQGIFDLESQDNVGITAKFSTCLAKNNINLCVIATFNTDYLLIKQNNLEKATKILLESGFEILQ